MSRNIQTTYYRRKALVKTNIAVDPNRAVLHAVNHLQHNQYEATHCEVFDNASGVLHAVLQRKMNGDIAVLFRREVQYEY